MQSSLKVFSQLFSRSGRFRLVLGAYLLSLVLSGCGLSLQRIAPDSLQFDPFVPPTLVPTLIPTETPEALFVSGQQDDASPGGDNVSGQPEETKHTDCVDDLKFIDDVTIPDGTVVAPGSALDKQWEVENSGTCNWNEKYMLKFISGEAMGAPTEQGIIPARTGSRVTLRIVFRAPDEPGSYKSAWQVHNAQGVPFGDPFFIEIVVE